LESRIKIIQNKDKVSMVTCIWEAETGDQWIQEFKASLGKIARPPYQSKCINKENTIDK
jgi:hypothetical protein